MKKLIVVFALAFFGQFLHAAPRLRKESFGPVRGGYLGHRIMLSGELTYSPFTTSIKDFYTRYNFQYGGNLHFIVGRYVTLGFNYNRWSLSGNNLYEGNFVSGDRVNGTEYGLTWRKFRPKRGGLAPFGKFWEINLAYAQNKFSPGAGNWDVLADSTQRLPKTSNMLIARVGFGTQIVFWNHFVASTGVRFGAPLYQVSKDNGTTYGDFMYRRVFYKEVFSVFAGVGVIF